MKQRPIFSALIAALGVISLSFTACSQSNKPTNTVTTLDTPKTNQTTAVEVANHPSGPISTKDFDALIGGNKLTVVDFYTTWCGPCKKMAPHMEKIHQDFSAVANVLKVDAEAQVEISDRYHLEGYPTVLFFKKGMVVHKALGYMDYEEIKTLINKYK